MIHPSEAHGKFRKWRVRLGILLGAIFLVLPWVRLNGHQAFLLDIPGRKFSIFGLLFWSHDGPLLLFVAGAFILAITLLTSVFGRVWCGWACPQTVFVDLVYRQIERWIEGDAVTRRRNVGAPFTLERFLRKTTKWFCFVVMGMVISHSLLGYFVGTDHLFTLMTSSPVENPISFLVMLTVLGFTVFNFGWFRERFCTQVCPYGRLQTVLLDEKSWVVAYDAKRGENRKGSVAGAPYGDCISCGKCVAVCPTGIDIREGLQLECIGCTACMDACDSVMRKIGKPEGLIRYSTQGAGSMRPTLRASIFRIRPMIYFGVLIGLSLGLFMVLRGREAIDFVMIRAVGSPFEEIRRDGEAGAVLNRFNIDLHNLTFNERSIELVPAGDSGAVKVVSNELPLTLAGGEQRRVSVFLQFPKSRLAFGKGHTTLQLKSRDHLTGVEIIRNEEVSLVGPY